MDYKETLRRSAQILNERARDYGTPERCFADAAAIASIMLRRSITDYDVVKIMEAVKLAREAESPHNADHYVDRINYTAFASQFAPKNQYERRDELEENIKEIAQKFAPPQRPKIDTPVVEN